MTTIAVPFTKEELAELDQLRWVQRTSRAEAIRTAVQFYARWADRLPYDDAPEEEIVP
jgi:metal-responsive CopG/Arc/MetJ family transcriptional regulator